MPLPVARIVLITAAIATSASAVSSQAPADRDLQLFTCGFDEQWPAMPAVRWFTIALAGDSRLYSPCPNGNHTSDHREMREGAVIAAGMRHPDPEVRRVAVQSYGRLARPEGVLRPPNPALSMAQRAALPPPPLAAALDDAVPGVRREAANAIGHALSGVVVEPGTGKAQPPTPEQFAAGRVLLDQRLKTETDVDVAATILETIGRLKYTDDAVRDQVEGVLVSHTTGASTTMLGAARGLESLIRGNPRRAIAPATRDRLRQLTAVGPTTTAVPTVNGEGSLPVAGDEDRLGSVRRLAMLMLQQVRDLDAATLQQAARDADWQVRRLVAQQIDLGRPEFAAIAQLLEQDTAAQVRYELIGPISRHASRTQSCAPLLAAFDDPSPAVALRAMDTLPTTCAEADEIGRRLKDLAERLSLAESAERWHAPAHALMALARINAGLAQPFVEAAAGHQRWQVRAAAARAAGSARDEKTVLTLARDREPNVRTAALEVLSAMKSLELAAEAIAALTSDDYQLVRTAATVLRGVSDVVRDEASSALVDALRRLTAKGGDTTRDPRVAIVQRLEEILPDNRFSQLTAFADDVDPRVVAAVQRAFTSRQTAGMPAFPQPKYRYPRQPTVQQLQQLPTQARIRMTDGAVIDLELLVRDAPVSVARFAELVEAGYYNGLTFHRIVPNFVVQGGSPGANEYMGVNRYWRDEPGLARHARGSVGLSTRGHDTADGQIFIDLVDLPRLDHDYTIFARVTAGLAAVDRFLEGARIESVTVQR